MATIVGAANRAEDVISEMQSRIEEVRTRTAGLPRPKVFCEEWGKPLIVSQCWVAELVDVAGGEVVAEPGKQISFEQVADTNPDILIAAWCGAADRVPLQKIVDARSWQELKAVRNGRVYCIRDEYLNTPAPTLLHGLDALAFAIHPELFPSTKGIRQITAVPGSTAVHI